MKIQSRPYGTLPDGKTADIYTMENSKGVSLSVITWGGCITNLLVPDRKGDLADVVLAHDSIDGFYENPGSFAAMIGRNSNRIRNSRIEISGNEYLMTANMSGHNCHCGSLGLKNRLFDAEVRSLNGHLVLLLSHTIPDLGDELPGALSVSIAIALSEDNAVMIDYRAVSDKDTIINLTNHSYFNLAGHANGTVLDHLLELDAGFYTPNGADCIPTGEILRVDGTPFDFRTAKPVGKDIAGDHPQIRLFGGYDHNFMLNGSNYRKISTLTDPKSGRVMTTFTDLPCVQLFTGNGLPASAPAKDGADYQKYSGLCLETQTCPNAVEMPWLASPVYLAGQEYISTTTYQFAW